MARAVIGADFGSYTFSASAKTITFGNLPRALRLEDIFLIYNLTTNTKIFQFALSGYSGSVNSSILTLEYDTTTMSDSDILQIFYEEGNVAIDFNTRAYNMQTLTPEWGRFTDPENLVTDQVLTETLDDIGNEIDVRGYNVLGIFVKGVVNDSQNVIIQCYGKKVSGGLEEYSIDHNSILLWSSGNNNILSYYEFNVGTIPVVQLKAQASILGATAGELTIDINKSKN